MKKEVKMKRVKWFDVNACEEMVGKDVTKNGKAVGKIVDVAPGEVTAELSKSVYKQIFSPILTSIGMKVDQ
jgi:ribosomal protein S3AE